MEGWFDIHNHVIPGVDDGAKDWQEAKKMLELLYKEGINNIITTPHYNIRYDMVSQETLTKNRDKLQKIAFEIDQKYCIYSGNELYYHHDATEDLNRSKILTMAESDYVLVEFSPAREFDYIKTALYQLQLEGYTPIMAHVERYDCLKKDVRNIIDLVDRGVYIQVNASSVVSERGFLKKKFVSKLLDQGLVHFVATDGHNLKSRPPLMRKCASYIERRYGRDTMEELLIHNPKKIIGNKTIGT